MKYQGHQMKRVFTKGETIVHFVDGRSKAYDSATYDVSENMIFVSEKKIISDEEVWKTDGIPTSNITWISFGDIKDLDFCWKW